MSDDVWQGITGSGQRTHAVRMRATMTASMMSRALCGTYVDITLPLLDTTLGTVQRMVSCQRCQRGLGA